MRKRSASRPFGFTMIEVIAVLLVIGIIGAVVATRAFISQQTVDNITKVDRLKGQLRFAQSRSMNTDSIWGIQFSGGTYKAFKDGATANGVFLPGENDMDLSLPSGTSVTQIVSFDGRGRPCTDAAGLTAATSDITLSVGGQTVTITKNTGHIP